MHEPIHLLGWPCSSGSAVGELATTAITAAAEDPPGSSLLPVLGRILAEGHVHGVDLPLVLFE